MSKILADKDIKGLIGTVLIDADPDRLNPNGVELRLGRHVIFHSTSEEMKLSDNQFLKVSPGESVVISSFEKIDFRKSTIRKHYPNNALMGFITPTTTMMREGISQVATKIDAGFWGNLNWGLRNGSHHDLILQLGEPIFKLTIFLLEGNEIPELSYGEREGDKYHKTDGVVRSKRNVPASIPPKDIISSSFHKLDPKIQLREAGHPFSHIGTELSDLQGKFEVVSKDVAIIKEGIEKETKKLTQKIDAIESSLVDKIDFVFTKKFIQIGGRVLGAGVTLFGFWNWLEKTSIDGDVKTVSAILLGILIIVVTHVLGQRSAPASKN